MPNSQLVLFTFGGIVGSTYRTVMLRCFPILVKIN